MKENIPKEKNAQDLLRMPRIWDCVLNVIVNKQEYTRLISEECVTYIMLIPVKCIITQSKRDTNVARNVSYLTANYSNFWTISTFVTKIALI